MTLVIVAIALALVGTAFARRRRSLHGRKSRRRASARHR